MKFKNDQQREAYEHILQMLQPDTIKGNMFHLKQYNKYKKLCKLMIDFFTKIPGAEIEIDTPVESSELTNVTVEVSDFEILDPELFVKILKTSEHTMFYSNTLNSFCLSVSILNIWTE